MKKPVYHYPEFVSNVTLFATKEKRYWLNLEIDSSKKKGIVVILKNPSRAKQHVSDKTVYNVCNYIFRNRNKFAPLQEVGNITIVNLIPHFQTYSERLKSMRGKLIDKKNMETIRELCEKNKNVIIAWGNHPNGLFSEYEQLKAQVMEVLKASKNNVFFVDKLSKANNPKHGQIWGYADDLIPFH